MAAQAGLCLAWSETPEDTFCRVMAYINDENKHAKKPHEPRHEKTCLREFSTRSGSNRHAQPQKLARVFICAFVVRIWHKTHFLMARLICFQFLHCFDRMRFLLRFPLSPNADSKLWFPHFRGILRLKYCSLLYNFDLLDIALRRWNNV